MGDIADVDERESRYTPEPWGCMKKGSFFFISSGQSFFFLFPTAGKDEVTFVLGLLFFLFTHVASFVFRLSVPVYPTLPFQTLNSF